MRLRTLLLVAVLCGAALAVTLALTLPGGEDGAVAAADDPLAATATAVPPAAPRAPTVAPAARRPHDPRRGERIVGAARIVTRAADPDGGPAWAIRAFGQRPTWRERDGRLLVRPRSDCMQLGRVLDGRFGWVDGSNVFRPVAPGSFGAPVQCGPAPHPGWWLSGAFQRVTRITHPAHGAPRPLQTVEWGWPRKQGAPPALRVGGAAQERAARAEYRVADPGGGPPLGFPRSTAGDPACLWSFEPLVGERPGLIDATLDTVTAERFGSGCPNGDDPTKLTHRHPLQAWAGSNAGLVAVRPAPQRGRVALRTLPGRTTLIARAHPDVVAVTVVSPRDVRTLTPSPHDHLLAAVWDGDFPTGAIELRARLRDGTVHVQRVWLYRP